MNNKEKKFGQLGNEEDPVITIAKEQVRESFRKPKCTLAHLSVLQWEVLFSEKWGRFQDSGNRTIL